MWCLMAILLADSVHAFDIALSAKESLHVEVSGHGTPVVLVPGLFGSAYAFRDVVPMLTESGYRTIVIEPLGVGASAKPERANYSLTAQADRVAAVLDTLAIRQAIVVAHSVGGSEGFRLAYRRPDLVRALITIEGGPAETAATPAFKRAMRFTPWIKLLGGVKLIRWKIRQMLIASSGDASWVTDSVVVGYTAAAARDLDGTLKAFIGVANAREPSKIQPHLGEIACPVLLMIGTAPHQGDVGPDEITLLERTLPHFILDSVPGAGHFLYEEHPQSVLLAVHRATAAVHPSGAGAP